MTAPRSMLGAIYAVRPPSGVARGAELGMELGSLVPQQAACSAARDVPAAPVGVVEPGTLSQQTGRDRAPRGGVEAARGPPPNPPTLGGGGNPRTAREWATHWTTRPGDPDPDVRWCSAGSWRSSQSAPVSRGSTRALAVTSSKKPRRAYSAYVRPPAARTSVAPPNRYRS